MNDNIQKMVDASIIERPADFREAFNLELGQRIMDRMSLVLPQEEIDEEIVLEAEDNEDENLEFDFGDEDEDLSEVIEDLFDDEEDDTLEEAAVADKVDPNKKVAPTNKKSVLDIIRDRAQKRFQDKHVINKKADRNGNGDDVFQASNITPVDRVPEHGYNPGDAPGGDEEVYENIKEYPEVMKDPEAAKNLEKLLGGKEAAKKALRDLDLN